MNNFLTTNFSLIKLVNASSGSTASADNQLIGTIMIGVGVVVILISVLVLISRFRSGDNAAPAKEDDSNSTLKPIVNQPSSPSKLPEGLPPIDQLQPKNTATETLPPAPATLPTAPVTPVQTPVGAVATTPTPELPKTYPNVPLSELAASTAGEKSYSLEDIEKSGNTTPPAPPAGV